MIFLVYSQMLKMEWKMDCNFWLMLSLLSILTFHVALKALTLLYQTQEIDL